MKGTVRVSISPELLIRVLHMPESCEIIGAIMTESFYPRIELIVEDEGLPFCSYGSVPIEASPVISHEIEKYTWDWNLPKVDKP